MRTPTYTTQTPQDTGGLEPQENSSAESAGYPTGVSEPVDQTRWWSPHVSGRRWWKTDERENIVWRTLPATLGELLAQVSDAPGRRRVWFVGPTPWADGGPRAWLTEKVPGWEREKLVLHSGSTAGITCRRVSDGSTVTVMDSAIWWGEAARTMNVGDARWCWGWLSSEIEHRAGGIAMLTPSATGLDMWLRSIPDGTEWAVLSDEVQDIIRATSGQGRIEATGDGSPVASATLVDARLAYVGVARELPGALIRWDRKNEFVPHRGRYRCRVIVPRDWAHVGICPRWTDEGVEFPSSGSFETWLDSSELALAVSKGWECRILERMIFAKGRPLDPLVNRIETMLDATTTAEYEHLRPALRSAVRAIVLHTIGSLHGTPGRTSMTGAQPPAETPADLAYSPRTGEYTWTVRAPSKWPATCHPEWSSTIWARARARLLDAPTADKGIRAGALHLDRARVLAMRVDALLIDGDPAWPDDGRNGRYRTVGSVPHVTSPRTNAEAVAIVRSIKGGM